MVPNHLTSQTAQSTPATHATIIATQAAHSIVRSKSQAMNHLARQGFQIEKLGSQIASQKESTVNSRDAWTGNVTPRGQCSPPFRVANRFPVRLLRPIA